MSTTNPNEHKSIMDRDDQMILSVLSAVEEEPELTQKDLASRLGIAVGLVNSYLKRVIYKGYVKTRNLQRRRLKYLLTTSGIKEKTRLTYEFLEYSYVFIRDIRRKTFELMEPYSKQGLKNVVLFGSGEVAELAMLTMQELSMNVVGVVDKKNVGKKCVNHVVEDVESILGKQDVDVIFVLYPQLSEEIKKILLAIPDEEDVVILTLDKKSPRL